MSSIFAKSSEPSAQTANGVTNIKNNDNTSSQCLSIDEIKKTIPPNAINQPRPDLITTHTEWRWRFFNINGRKLIEMSCKHPNKPRTFMDISGIWSITDENELIEFEKFIQQQSYYYVKNTD